MALNENMEQKLKTAERLRTALLPKFHRIFSDIAGLECGVKCLVDIRGDVLDMLPSLHPQDSAFYLLKALNSHLKQQLTFLFNVGLLNLERVTWDSSCYMLQKISDYEAVHPVRSWTDLKQRVGPYRRCYVFTHSSMPKEPIVMLHTALTSEISSSISSIVPSLGKPVSDEIHSGVIEDVEDPSKIQSAIFYSISSTQKGLHGIELGNMLIKKVAGEVLKEFPHITKLSSLSPIPGFRDWLLLEINKVMEGSSPVFSFFSKDEISSICSTACIGSTSNFWSSFRQMISSNRWTKVPMLGEYLKEPLLRTCTYYLIRAKRRSYALNSVAHFHLRNGAVLWRLNWAADFSPRGLSNSCGIMVNYRYFMEETEKNSQEYIENFDIKISDSVRNYLVLNGNSSKLNNSK